MTDYKMLSLDTASVESGYAIWKGGNLSSYGLFDLNEFKGETFDRVTEMIRLILNLITKEKPQTIVIENNFFTSHRKTYAALAPIIGAVRGYCILHNIEYIEYTPSEWRKFINDVNTPKKREELKLWGINYVNSRFNIKINNDNTSDAILIGYARIKEFSM